MAALVCASIPLLHACDKHDCRDCSDSAYWTIRTFDGTWADGSYVFAFDADGKSQTCVLDVPDDVPDPNDAGSSVRCDPSMTLFVEFAIGQCEPPRKGFCYYADRFSLYGHLPGLVERVRLRVTRDDVQIFDLSREVGYHVDESFPDPECKSCRQGSVAFSIP